MATATETAHSEALAIPNEGGPGVQILLDLERAGAIDRVSLTLTDPSMPYETWEDMGRFLGSVDRSTRWWLGDWLNFGADLYGEEHAQAVDTKETRYDVAERVTGLDHGTLLNISSICGRIAKSRRQEKLGFWTHDAVAALEPAEQTKWLKKAVKENWNRAELRAAIKEALAPASEPEPEPPGEGGPAPLSPAERLAQAASVVVNTWQPTGDGQYLVPGEAAAQLIAAVGGER